MANAGPDTNGSQFFLVYEDSRLRPDYTVFGHVTEEGLRVLDEIAAAGIDPGTEGTRRGRRPGQPGPHRARQARRPALGVRLRRAWVRASRPHGLRWGHARPGHRRCRLHRLPHRRPAGSRRPRGRRRRLLRQRQADRRPPAGGADRRAARGARVRPHRPRQDESLFAERSFDAVVHFAGLKAVGESVDVPLEYYQNNLDSTFALVRAMRATAASGSSSPPRPPSTARAPSRRSPRTCRPRRPTPTAGPR